MAAKVLHFGTNDCRRVLVLRSAGYVVDDCPSLSEFELTLKQDIDPQAFFFSERYPVKRREAMTLARCHSHAPLVLFQSIHYSDDEPNFDLVIPPLTAPAVWLHEVAATIERTRTLRSSSAAILERSVWLRHRSKILRQTSASERERSARQLRIAEKVIIEFRKSPGTS